LGFVDVADLPNEVLGALAASGVGLHSGGGRNPTRTEMA
jgi:hypothetical protein